MSVIERIAANQKGRDFVVGDVHGWLEPLQAELDALCFNPECDRLFSVGDLINRGPDSAACLLLTQEPWFHAVRGNHEQILFDWLADPAGVDVDAWMRYGGRAWLGRGPEHFFARNTALRVHAEYLANVMPWVIELSLADGRRVAISHSSLPAEEWLELQLRLPQEASLRESLIWDRPVKASGFERTVEGIDLCVHGHVVVPRILRRGNGIYIDTGAALFDSRYKSDDQIPHPRISAIQVEDLFRVPGNL
ncbi:MAG: metallophosphoesterase [Oceanospirillales bacterium]|nr:metallophosphoesterase [Oceanospirillales bacterium]